MLSLFPLFPGNNEKDQIHKIHNILGTPSKEILERFQRCATNIDFNFPHAVGTGVAPLVPHIPAECLDMICKMLIYNPDERITAKQALNSPYFKELRAQEQKTAPSRELGSVSPSNAADEHSIDGGETYPKKSDGHKRKMQQGTNVKKTDHYVEGTNDYEDLAINNVTSVSLTELIASSDQRLWQEKSRILYEQQQCSWVQADAEADLSQQSARRQKSLGATCRSTAAGVCYQEN